MPKRAASAEPGIDTIAARLCGEPIPRPSNCPPPLLVLPSYRASLLWTHLLQGWGGAVVLKPRVRSDHMHLVAQGGRALLIAQPLLANPVLRGGSRDFASPPEEWHTTMHCGCHTIVLWCSSASRTHNQWKLSARLPAPNNFAVLCGCCCVLCSPSHLPRPALPAPPAAGTLVRGSPLMVITTLRGPPLSRCSQR